MMIPKGFAGLPMEDEFITNAENKKNYAIAVQDWNYGPEVPTNEPGANKPFYAGLAEAMQCNEKDARRKHCSNCDYYDNTFMTQVKIERISCYLRQRRRIQRPLRKAELHMQRYACLSGVGRARI